MRPLLPPLALSIVLALAAPAQADFAAGVAAYDRGDYGAAYEEWLPLARRGDLAAQRNLGHLYRSGLGVAQDFAQAAEWYRRAAESGLSSAQVNLGTAYLRGQGVPEDAARAARWFEEAARQGHPLAQYNLGLLYLKGTGVPGSEARALGWLNLAARQGNQPALDLLSEFVQRPPAEASQQAAPGAAAQPLAEDEPAPPPPAQPSVVEAEPPEAAPLPPSPDPAAAAAPPAAERDVSLGEVGGFMSRTFGRLFGGAEPAPAAPEAESRAQLASGVVALHAGNYAVARERLEPLARAGDAEAQLQLGLLHSRDDYGAADLAQAWAWLELAARQGRADAAADRRRLEPRLADGQKAEALRLVDGFVSR